MGQYEGLDKGIRKTVAWLNANGFGTTDSGDGVSKFDGVPEDEQMDCAMDVANVAMSVEPADLLAEADRLLALCVSIGLDPEDTVMVDEQEMPLWQIEATYIPASGVGLILLTGVDDDLLTKKGI